MLFHKKHKLLFCTCFLLFIASIFFCGKPALAHKVNIFAYVENNTIFTESYFQDGKSVINGKIEVYDSKNVLIHTGQTDRNGEYSFKVPKVDDLTIVLDATLGHRAMYVLKADEIGEISIQEEPEKSPEEIEVYKEGGILNNQIQDSKIASDIGLEAIRNVVHEEVERQIKPLTKNIAQLQKEVGFSIRDIFAGIGYILGLMGLVLYFKSKGRK